MIPWPPMVLHWLKSSGTWNYTPRPRDKSQDPRFNSLLLYTSHHCNVPLPQANISQFSFVTPRHSVLIPWEPWEHVNHLSLTIYSILSSAMRLTLHLFYTLLAPPQFLKLPFPTVTWTCPFPELGDSLPPQISGKAWMQQDGDHFFLFPECWLLHGFAVCGVCVWKQGLRFFPATGTVGIVVLAWKPSQASGLVSGLSEELGPLLFPQITMAMTPQYVCPREHRSKTKLEMVFVWFCFPNLTACCWHWGRKQLSVCGLSI